MPGDEHLGRPRQRHDQFGRRRRRRIQVADRRRYQDAGCHRATPVSNGARHPRPASKLKTDASFAYFDHFDYGGF